MCIEAGQNILIFLSPLFNPYNHPYFSEFFNLFILFLYFFSALLFLPSTWRTLPQCTTRYRTYRTFLVFYCYEKIRAVLALISTAVCYIALDSWSLSPATSPSSTLSPTPSLPPSPPLLHPRPHSSTHSLSLSLPLTLSLSLLGHGYGHWKGCDQILTLLRSIFLPLQRSLFPRPWETK